MSALASRLAVAVALAFVIRGYYAQTTCEVPRTVCYITASRSRSYTGYYRQSYTDYYSCWWSRCSRTRYRTRATTRYRTEYYSTFGCCSGYQRIGNTLSCEPICNDCDANHTCIAPYTCVCPTGWTGTDCDIDVDECVVNAQLNGTQCGGPRQCEQTCTNTIGSYNCSCSSEYNLADDLHNCLGMPENITFNATSSRSMILSWDPPGEDLRNGTIQSYSIICSSDDHVGFYLRQIIPVSFQSILMIGLNPFISYNCCIATITTNGNGPYQCDSGITLQDVPGDSPTGIVVTNTSAYSLFIEWEPPNTPNGIIVNYTIYLDYNNGTTDIRITDSNTTEYLLEGLSPHQLVGVEMTANTSIGEGPRSAIQEIRTHQAVPTPVTALDTQRLSSTSLQLTWGLPEVLNGILVYYDVNVSSISIGYFETWRIQADDPLQLNISGLEPYVPYTIEVSAATHAGEGDVNTIIDFTEEGIPDVPAITSINRISATDIQVTWTQLTLEESRGFPTVYSVAYSPTERAKCPEVDPDTNTILTTSSEDSQLVITDLDPRLQYCIGIAASTVAGSGDFSNTEKVLLYTNSLFQLRFSGISSCVDWVNEDSPEKVADIMNLLTLQIINTCDCDFSNEYVADPSLACEMSDYKVVIFQAKIISTAENKSTEFLQLLQAWARNEPLVVVNHVQLRLVMECSVELNEIGETECIPSDGAGTAAPETATTASPQPTVSPSDGAGTAAFQNATTASPQPTVSLTIVISIASVCGALLLITLVVIVVSIFCCRYVKRKTKAKIRRNDSIYRYRDPRLTGAKENPIAGINTGNVYDAMEDNFDETASTAELVLEKPPIQ